ncbi:MAG TPA: NAD(P)-dependent oxidoreductase [bacterium]|nr:NAD(P)-dependent oxidoreductase [bacterium]
MAKKRVLLTGASGSMGNAALLELLNRRERYDIVLLLRPSQKNKDAFARYADEPGVRIVWGDLGQADDVLRAVDGVDYVLHPAAMIAPAADHHPQQARKSNYEGTVNIVEAIKKQPDGGAHVRFVNVCTVAAYGDRLPPNHMIRVGDPLYPSVGDYYAITKIAAERAVIEAGLKYWASMRQTYIAIPKAWTLMDPIMFHQPLDQHIELITDADAGYGLVQTLEAPDEFFGRVYNMSGGPSCRVVYEDYLKWSMEAFGQGDYRKVVDRNWFTLRNFHCGWYEDGDELNKFLGHWRQSLQDHQRQVESCIPPLMKLGSKLSPAFVSRLYMKRLADPLKWIAAGKQEIVKAFYGGPDEWKKIPAWGEPFAVQRQASERPPLPTTPEQWAQSRGGELLERGDGKHQWRCGFGHEFEASPKTIAAGHWCPQCMAPPWNYAEIAKRDPAIARLYFSNHTPAESQCVDYLYLPNE